MLRKELRISIFRMPGLGKGLSQAKSNKYLGVLVSGLVLFLSACQLNAQKNTDVTVDVFEKAIQQPNVQVLDVRTREEFESGYIKNAFWANWNDSQQFVERMASLDKTKPVYTYCLVGGRSAAAVKWLRQNGFEAYNMAGGISKWKQANKKVEVLKAVTQMSYETYLSSIPANKTVLVDVGAFWCPPCKAMEPVVEQVLREKGDKIEFLRIEGGLQTALVKQLNVESFPTFIVYKNGREVWRKHGLMDAETLKKPL